MLRSIDVWQQVCPYTQWFQFYKDSSMVYVSYTHIHTHTLKFILQYAHMCVNMNSFNNTTAIPLNMPGLSNVKILTIFR